MACGSVPHGGEGMVVGTVDTAGLQKQRLVIHISEGKESGREAESVSTFQGPPLREPLLPVRLCFSKVLQSLKMSPLKVGQVFECGSLGGGGQFSIKL